MLNCWCNFSVFFFILKKWGGMGATCLLVCLQPSAGWWVPSILAVILLDTCDSWGYTEEQQKETMENSNHE